ncbi:acyl carrier protein [Flavivirga eckloniae]|uniref:Acyl carrier protein n=1 Tax=Flavivirga eckloniae TaxID=1803846 RepID=A0A2K9PK69_9FLAO|nr:acyl carrier protein [Flavivirga eckloniae]AUP77248.1 acyl carrier protein [Flavivirga eckloniae]
MTREDILSKVNEAFTKILEHNNFELKDETTAHDVDGWESVTHMLIITEIENMFGIKFKLMDLMNMDNVGDLLKAIETETSNTN